MVKYSTHSIWYWFYLYVGVSFISRSIFKEWAYYIIYKNFTITSKWTALVNCYYTNCLYLLYFIFRNVNTSSDWFTRNAWMWSEIKRSSVDTITRIMCVLSTLFKVYACVYIIFFYYYYYVIRYTAQELLQTPLLLSANNNKLVCVYNTLLLSANNNKLVCVYNTIS